MGCTHPYSNEILAVRDESDKVIGMRCPGCGMSAWVGESTLALFWRVLKESVTGRRRDG